MLTNTDCTLYFTQDNETYCRVYCPACHWDDTRGQNISKTGSTAVDSVRVFLPLPTADLHGAEGYLVWGECQFEPSGSRPLRDLIAQGSALTISSIALFDYGSPELRHWEVYAK